MKLKTVLLGVACCTLGAGLIAHERLLHPSTKNPLFWNSPTNISIVINETGSDNIDDGSHETAIKLAIEEWNQVAGSVAQLNLDTNPASTARTDYASSNIHLVLFDENNSSGFFGGNGTVAVTPVWFFSNGVISDADVLYNGGDFSFTTSGSPGRFDVQDVGAHELGHLLGFDHSGWAGATMYPYVDPTVILHRSLSRDDIGAMRSVYPNGSFGSISGSVKRVGDSSIVIGAHVVARDSSGRTAAAILTDPQGNFVLSGLDPETYTVYAVPLEGAVTDANLGSGYTNGILGYEIQTDFEATVFGSTITVANAGDAETLGSDLLVGADVNFTLGSTSDNYPYRLNEGQTRTLTVRGSNLSTGTSLVASDPTVTINSLIWSAGSVQFQCTVQAGSPVGHFDLTATNLNGDRSILVAPIEVTPDNPTVTVVSPNQGNDSGGSALTITGTGFNPGARVVIGDTIYIDGAAGGCTVVNDTTITLTTATMIGGNHDVVVLDPSGVEGRLVDGFQSLSVPSLDSVFPAAGSQTGGTEIILTGTNFAFDAEVRIDGVLQTNVTIDSTERVVIHSSTAAGSLGAKTVQVVNPGPISAQAAFTYVAQADPQFTNVNPPTGSAGGGETIMISGSGFDANTQVLFNADPDTGTGGTMATSVNVLDANTLEVETPAVAAGDRSVLIRNGSTGQADLASAAFTFTGGGGGGGGGCYIVDPTRGGPFDPRGFAEGAAWLLLLFAAIGFRAYGTPGRSQRAR